MGYNYSKLNKITDRLSVRLFLRWLANLVGLWLIFKAGLIDRNPGLVAIFFGALILALLNALLKPLLVVFTLPAIALTLGFFLIIINGLIFYIAGLVYSPLKVSSFWVAVLAGLVIGLVNYSLTLLLELKGNNDE